MALSRLQNLLNNPTGVVLFVDNSNFDATDGIENRGTSPTRPFISIQRACIEASRFSFQKGRNNDLNDRTTIIVSPGKHYIDNRPGFSIEDVDGDPVYRRRIGKDTWTETTLFPLDENSNFDVLDPNNDLYKYNSVNGGIILPRGTSIVALDLRKTKIVPLYVPDPLDNDIERSSIFNVTGSCYFREFTFFDADATKFAYKNYSNTKHVPKYSHHKLSAFVYADGVNEVILNSEPTGLTDLDMYYHKITIAYDNLSNRGLEDFPESLDFEPNINEFRIVGPLQEAPIGISSIRAGNGDGSGDRNIITVTTADLRTKIITPHSFAVDTPVVIGGVVDSPDSYNGTFLVREVIDENTFTYVTTSIPQNVLPNPISFENATVATESDTVSSSSPYVFNCSLKSTYGMCGMWADGSKSLGFKSMVVAQFTGISLQKDNNAYLIYDNGILYDNTTLPANSKLRPLYQNSRSFYKPDFENFHIKASNDAFIQAVSVFAIGYCNQFITESGADMSITNSNSNFGSNALNSIGFKKEAFARDDVGYITHIIPPKEIEPREANIPWLSLDIQKIKESSDASRLYIRNFNDLDIVPPHQLEGYRIGAKLEDKLFIDVDSSPIIMPVPNGTTDGSISKKEYKIARVSDINNITSSGIITLSTNHSLFSGEKIRLFSNTGQMPDGLKSDKVYYVITSSVDNTLSANQIKLSNTLTEALSNNQLTGLTNVGGVITVISSVTDKLPGEFGHPIQWDEDVKNWYILSSSNSTNQLRSRILDDSYPEEIFGVETPTTTIKRVQDNRRVDERIYKVRYVIPKEFTDAKPPQVGYIIQESNSVDVSSISVQSDTELSNSTEIRNDKVIIDATTSNIVDGKQIATITTELPHNLLINDIVNIKNIRSSNNLQALGTTETYNGEYKVLNILSPRKFTYELTGVKVNPGTFTNNINQRATAQQRENLPLVSRQSYKDNFYIYRIETVKQHIPGQDGQDGIYHLIILSSSVRFNEEIGYRLDTKSFNPDVRNLYPQIDRDNINSDPTSSISYPDLSVIGKVITDDKKKSITLESINKFNKNNRIGFNISGVSVSGIGGTTVTLTTDIKHNLNSIRRVSFVSSGSGYSPNSSFYSKELIDSFPLEEKSTCNYTTTSAGSINEETFTLVDVGAGHTVGETLQVSGSLTPAIIRVDEIVNNVGDTIELSGFIDTQELNGVYQIINIPSKKSIVIHVPNGVDNYLPNTSISQPFGYVANKGISIASMQFSDLTVGIATITTSDSHGLLVGSKFKIVNSNRPYYNNKDFVVDNVVGINTFTFNVENAPDLSLISSGKILKYGISSSALNVGINEENLSSRGYTFYSGLSVKLTADLNIEDGEINVDNYHGIKRGDFITIGNEILRISETPSDNNIKVIRGQLGTNPVNVISGTIVRKIRIIPTEVRRPSSLRASGQTFEYVGYGPGNYSTALPQRQDRILDDSEVLVSQAKKQDSGSIVYTGMNDLGEFYTGSKKISATTGEETTIEAPIITYTGDDLDGDSSKKQTGIFDELLIRDKIVVEGGRDGRQNSQFYGPVSFNSKLTNLSDSGVLVSKLYLRGENTSDKLISLDLSSGKIGDISLVSNPSNIGYVGSVYLSNEWRPFGPISIEKDKLNLTVDNIGIGTTSGGKQLYVVGDVRIQNLDIYGSITLPTSINLGDVQFNDILVNKTARFTGIGTDYTQIHERGASILNNLEVVGISTFFKDVSITKSTELGATIPTLYTDRLEVNDNIQIGIANSNTISTKTGNLIFDSQSNNSIFNSNLNIVNNKLSITSGISTALIEGGNTLTLGIGHTNRQSFIDLNNDTRETPYGLRIIRNSGDGNRSSTLIHRGTSSFDINAFDNAEVRILTNNINRLAISTNGSIISYGNANGVGINDCNLRLSQAGTGDVSLYWDVTRNNANRRWYSGIDVSDNFSWKLASPLQVIPYGSENYTNDTKLKVDIDGNLTISPGGLSVSGITSLDNLRVNGIATFSQDIIGTATTATLANNLNRSVSTGIGLTGGGTLNGQNLSLSVDSTVVRTVGIQDIGGTKTFSNTIIGTATTATLANNLNRSVSTGIGLTGGGTLNGQNLSLSVDSTVVRTVGIQDIGGTKTFLDNIQIRNSSPTVFLRDTNHNSAMLHCNSNLLYFLRGGVNSDIWVPINNQWPLVLNLQNNDAVFGGNVAAIGDITAFASDIRLKTNIKPIKNSLNKVLSLSGFTYNFNETGKNLGFDETTRHSGVSAQEVQKVLPEAVCPAPVDESYLTVKYEKLVPLLIEAIKEQNQKIEQLERRIQQLGG